MSTQEAFSLAADINMKQNYLKTDYVVCLFFFLKILTSLSLLSYKDTKKMRFVFLLEQDILLEFDLCMNETFNMLIFWLIFPFGRNQQSIIGSNVIQTYLNL